MDGLTGLMSRGDTAVGPNNWGVRWCPAPRARLRLFCLPHAGGGAVAFRRWAQLLAPDIDVVAIRLPGRESRLREPPIADLDRLVAALVRDIEPWLDRPHAWFGHSMGGGVAFEVLRAMRRFGMAEPIRLVVAASLAPHLPRRAQPVHDAPVEDLLVRIAELNGSADSALANRGVLSSLLPMLRADFAVAETAVHRPERALDCPISVYGGIADDSVDRDGLTGWRQHSTAEVTVRLFEGGHFFVHQDIDHVLPAVAADLLGVRPVAGQPQRFGTTGLAVGSQEASSL